jgi:hypothetical protein
VVHGTGSSYGRDVEVALGQFRLPDAPREHVTTAPDQEWVRPAHLWELTAGSAPVLRRPFPGGLFAYHAATARSELPPEGWLEDPTVYRHGVIMLDIVSHEGAAMLEVTAKEHREIAAIGIRTRKHPPWEPITDE